MARILVAKRLPEESYAILPVLLEKTSGQWPGVEYALSRAYQEFLMPAEAADLLGPLYDADLLNLVPLLEYAATLGQIGDWPKAAEVLALALLRSPESHNIERHLAIAEMQAGVTGGRERIERLLAIDPDDKDLQEYLKPGPMPLPPASFDPTPLLEGDEH
jgi:tetratricopeptide (TPR) repeat protein